MTPTGSSSLPAARGIELALTALAGPGDEVLINARRIRFIRQSLRDQGDGGFLSHEKQGWQPDVEHVGSLITPSLARSLSSSQQSDRRRISIEATGVDRSCDRHNFPLLADEVYADLAFTVRCRHRGLERGSARDYVFVVVKAYLAPGWRSGWLAVGKTDRLDEVLGGIKLADGRLCSTGPMEYALAEALTGDRSHQHAFRLALRERRQTWELLNAIDGMTCARPTARFLRDASLRSRRARATRTSYSDCFARPACCACTDPALPHRPAMVSSASSSSPRRPSSARSIN